MHRIILICFFWAIQAQELVIFHNDLSKLRDQIRRDTFEHVLDSFSDEQKKVITQKLSQLKISNSLEDKELQQLMREAYRTYSSELLLVLGLNIILEPLKLKATLLGGNIYIYNLYKNELGKIFRGRRNEKVTLSAWAMLNDPFEIEEREDLEFLLVDYYTIFICPMADELIKTLFLIIDWITAKGHIERLKLIESIMLQKTNDHYFIKLYPDANKVNAEILLKNMYQLLNDGEISASPVCKLPPAIRINDLISYAQGDEFYKNPQRVLSNHPHPDKVFDKKVDYALYREDFVSADPDQKKSYRLNY